MNVYRYFKKKLHQREVKNSIRLISRLDSGPIPNELKEIRLFMAVRNEELRLPFLLNRYREYGVDRFFIIENNSTDGTLEHILGQEDVHVFQTSETYQKNWNWMEWLLETYGKERWCVVVDADELLVYPHFENHNLHSLCAYLDQRRQTALKCVLLDMYSEQEIENVTYSPGEDFLQACPCFDPWSFRRAVFRHTNRKTFQTYSFDGFAGGMRERVFGLQNCATKIPLLKYGESVYLQGGMHSIDGATLSELQGTVLHFKFLQDFRGRVMKEVEREEHWKKALEYKAYLKTIEPHTKTVFFNQHSLRYENSAQLQKLGFLKSSAGFEAYVESQRQSLQGSVQIRK